MDWCWIRSPAGRVMRRASVLLAGLAAIGPGAADAQVVRFEFASYSVAENAGNDVDDVCLVRSGNLDVGFFAFISTEDGTATGCPFPLQQPCDYCAWTDLRLVFLPGATRVCHNWSNCIFDDSLEEGDEFFRVRITGLSSGIIGSPSEATVTIRDDESAPEGLVVTFTDHGHRWVEDPVIPYEITVSNSGPPIAGLVVTETVPVQTVHLASESTPGWTCDPGPDEGSRCDFFLGDLPTGASRTILFAARVLEGTPEEFEILNSIGLASDLGGPSAAARAATGDGQATACSSMPFSLDDCEDLVLGEWGDGACCNLTRITFDPLGCCLGRLIGGGGTEACEDQCLWVCSRSP